MAGSIVQQRTAVSNTSSLTIADTITGVTAGNHIIAHVGCDDGASGFTIGVNDGTAYASGDGNRIDTGNNQFGCVLYKENSGSGNFTVTATATGSGTPSNMLLRLFEVSGLQTSGSKDQATGQFQATPGTGANGVSSGATAATTNANDFVMAFTQNTGQAPPGTSAITAGTGYTKSGTDDYMACESKSVAATGAQTGTFTQSVATARVTHVIAFKEIGGAVDPFPIIPKAPQDRCSLNHARM